MISAVDVWIPFESRLNAAGCCTRLEDLRQTARLVAGPRAADHCRLPALAETDPAAIEPACQALNAMTATDKRAIWASYAALARAA